MLCVTLKWLASTCARDKQFFGALHLAAHPLVGGVELSNDNVIMLLSARHRSSTLNPSLSSLLCTPLICEPPARPRLSGHSNSKLNRRMKEPTCRIGEADRIRRVLQPCHCRAHSDRDMATLARTPAVVYANCGLPPPYRRAPPHKLHATAVFR